jgi:hypothetical protein
MGIGGSFCPTCELTGTDLLSSISLFGKLVALHATCFDDGFLPGLFFHLEDGGDMFLRNFGWLSKEYTAYYPRR